MAPKVSLHGRVENTSPGYSGMLPVPPLGSRDKAATRPSPPISPLRPAPLRCFRAAGDPRREPLRAHLLGPDAVPPRRPAVPPVRRDAQGRVAEPGAPPSLAAASRRRCDPGSGAGREGGRGAFPTYGRAARRRAGCAAELHVDALLKLLLFKGNANASTVRASSPCLLRPRVQAPLPAACSPSRFPPTATRRVSAASLES